jgi:hypothetical protein
VPGGETFEGDELLLSAIEPVLLEAISNFAVLVNDVPSFTITDERITPLAPPPTLNIVRSAGGVTLSWLDLNRVYWLDEAATFSDGFMAVTNIPAYSGNLCEVTLRAEGTRFFRLRHLDPGD